MVGVVLAVSSVTGVELASSSLSNRDVVSGASITGSGSSVGSGIGSGAGSVSSVDSGTIAGSTNGIVVMSLVSCLPRSQRFALYYWGRSPFHTLPPPSPPVPRALSRKRAALSLHRIT